MNTIIRKLFVRVIVKRLKDKNVRNKMVQFINRNIDIPNIDEEAERKLIQSVVDAVPEFVDNVLK